MHIDLPLLIEHPKSSTFDNGKRARFRRCSMIVSKFSCAHAFCAALTAAPCDAPQSHEAESIDQ
jgi:hypothetical protein